MEASGTGNMKFALNGALTVGTLDGANVEIRERVGEENIYIFGLKAHEVAARRAAGNDSRAAIEADGRLREVLEQIYSGVFSPDAPNRFHGVLGQLYDNDWFMVTPDFALYHAIQRDIDRDFRNRDAWMRRAILNTANVGWFSADRTIRGYARDVWDVPVADGTAHAAAPSEAA
jgi:starch phosphorylase